MDKKAPPNNGPIQSTGDVLRPTRTRTVGSKPIVWYAIISALSIVGIVYLVGLFAAPKARGIGGGASASTARQVDGDAAWRYAGGVREEDQRLAHARRVANRPPDPARATPIPAVAVTQGPGSIIVPRINAASLGSGSADTGGSFVPDVTGSRWANQRVILPTPVPGEDGGVAHTAAQSDHAGIVVVYGAPNVANTPVPATESSSATQEDGASPLPSGSASAMPPGAFAAMLGHALSGVAGAASSSTVAHTTMASTTLQAETMPAVRRPPTARYMIVAGTPLTTQLDVAVESDVAGPVRAHLVRDAVDSLTGETLIPRGSWILGKYTGLTGGQSRLSFQWTRIIFPDRSSFALDNTPALDEEGRAGVGGTVDDHRASMIRTSLFSGILAEIGNRLSQTSTPSLVSIGGYNGTQPGLAQAALELANRINDEDAARAPVVTIQQNAIFTLYVDRDMLFDGPYTPMQAER